MRFVLGPLLAGSAIAVLLTPAARAQEPVGTVAGVVFDATTGSPVPAATLYLDGQGRGTTTDSLGVFRLANLTEGPGLLRVEALGYEEQLVPVTVGAAPASLEIQLRPDPLSLEGIEVTGRPIDAALSGVVLDASTGEGIPWASLWLRDVRRFSGDGQGGFRLSNVTPGSHLLLVERLGYEGLWVPVRVTSTPEPIVVRLQPDPVLLEGISVVIDGMEDRRNAFGDGPVRAYGEERLRGSAAPDLQHFLEWDGLLAFQECTRTGELCVAGRRRPVQPSVYIDDVFVPCGVFMLASYPLVDVYAVEVYDGGAQIRVFSYDFMERRGRRPRQLIPADIHPPPLGC